MHWLYNLNIGTRLVLPSAILPALLRTVGLNGIRGTHQGSLAHAQTGQTAITAATNTHPCDAASQVISQREVDILAMADQSERRPARSAASRQKPEVDQADRI